MKSSNSGHNALNTPWPDPLAGTGLWNIGAMALPAPMLSICSALVFAIVVVYLRSGGATQELFVLPWHTAFAIAAASAGVAWLIVFRCRQRPGRLGPRLWALSLAAANSLIAVLTLVARNASWSLTLAVAGLSAAIALAPRLLKVRPDSPMVQRIAPISLLILLVTVPSSCAVRKAIAGKTEERVDRRIQQLRLWTMDVKEVAGFGWVRMEDAPEGAKRGIEKLRALRFVNQESDAELWRSAAILGKDDELATAQQELTEAVVAALAPDRVPRVSTLKEPAVRWNQEQARWEAYSQFAGLSEITGGYYSELGRLFAELESTDETIVQPAIVTYRGHYAGQRKLLAEYLDQTASTWTDNWGPFRVPNVGVLIGRERMPLDAVLRAPFLTSDGLTLAAGQLAQLAAMPAERMQAMACGGRDTAARTAPGCRCQSYEHGEREYVRLDCYSYRPRAEGTGAELRVEMRLVYQSEEGRRVHDGATPSEIYFHFLVPQGKGSDNFREEVMTSLAAAVRASGGNVRASGIGGSVVDGFVIEQDGGVVRVYRPAPGPLRGLTPELDALIVRAIPRTAGG